MKTLWLAGALAGLALTAAAAARPAGAQAPDGKAIYEANCRKCHGVRGIPSQMIRRKMEKIPTLDSLFMAHRSDDSLVTVLKRGKGDDMKSFAAKLTPDEMAAVTRYVRELATKPHGQATQ